MLTKASVGHPNEAKKDEGHIALKRIVQYEDGNATRADVMKVSFDCAPHALTNPVATSGWVVYPLPAHADGKV